MGWSNPDGSTNYNGISSVDPSGNVIPQGISCGVLTTVAIAAGATYKIPYTVEYTSNPSMRNGVNTQFVCPITGLYSVIAKSQFQITGVISLSIDIEAWLYVNGTKMYRLDIRSGSLFGKFSLDTILTDLSLMVGDYIEMVILNAATSSSVNLLGDDSGLRSTRIKFRRNP